MDPDQMASSEASITGSTLFSEEKYYSSSDEQGLIKSKIALIMTKTIHNKKHP